MKTQDQGDEITISNGNKTLTMKAINGQPGDFVRVITRTPETNTAPVARDVTTAVNENAISSAGDVVASSDDADGDALHISKIPIQIFMVRTQLSIWWQILIILFILNMDF